jgi:DnaJ-class molecular chaperone
MQMKKYAEITWARKVLGLPEEVTREQIRRSYRDLIKQWHPDSCSEENAERCKEMAASINSAYKILSAYCDQYKISFSEEEVTKYLSEDEWWFRRFGKDPLWGKH